MIGKKKKLIVPVVAIMMCAVALMGVVYALQTTVSDQGTIDDTGYQVIDLYSAKDTPTTTTFTITGIKIYTARVANTNTTTINADLTNFSFSPNAYVAVHKTTNGTPATNPDATATNAATVSATAAGWSDDGAVLSKTVGSCTITVTFGLGTAIAEGDLAGYRPVTCEVSVSGTYTGGAHAAAQAVQTALNGLDFELTFASTI